MDSSPRALISGRSREQVQAIEAMLAGLPGITLQTRVVANGHVDPLYGLTQIPQVLVMILSEHWADELNALLERAPRERPATLVLGAPDNASAMRLAMQAGVRDYLLQPVVREELIGAVQKVLHAERSGVGGTARITAVMNAKGGAGASFLACNVAHTMAAQWKRRVALVDLDLQFGSLALGLDLNPRIGILQALAAARELDAVSLEGYATRHASGVELYGVVPDHVVLPGEIAPAALVRVLELLGRAYDHVVVDLPRQIDPLATAVIERAENIAVVVQQSIAHARDGKRLTGILRDELEIPAERLRLVLNRYEPKHRIGRAEIEQSLRCARTWTIPNDFRRAAEAADVGVPLHDAAARAPITRSIHTLAGDLLGIEPKRGLLSRAFGGWFAG
jgi:pilus assembly protein CpaE